MECHNVWNLFRGGTPIHLVLYAAIDSTGCVTTHLMKRTLYARRNLSLLTMVDKFTPSRWLITALLSLILVLQGCSDGGVVINDAGSGDSNGGSSGTPTGEELIEPDDGGPTGQVPAVTSVSNLDPEDVAASRFLAQATFGATPATIAELKSTGFEAWIDQQMSLPVSLTEPYTRANSNGSNGAARHEAWWNNALNEPDQLRQRVAFALSEIFVVSDLDYLLANNQWGMASYYDMLSRNAFGNYRTLLEDVTLHPVMGVYLSMVLNERPNEEQNILRDGGV